jgi:hypothetical protein
VKSPSKKAPLFIESPQAARRERQRAAPSGKADVDSIPLYYTRLRTKLQSLCRTDSAQYIRGSVISPEYGREISPEYGGKHS